jgi:hypothetical protein
MRTGEDLEVATAKRRLYQRFRQVRAFGSYSAFLNQLADVIWFSVGRSGAEYIITCLRERIAQPDSFGRN